MGNPNLVSDGGKYALDFLTKEALWSQDIDFQQSLIEQKRSQTRTSERRIKELYDRFNQNKIRVQELLRGLSFHVANKK